MNRLFVFDMDGTLLPNTTAMLQIAQTTGHTQDLEVLEKQLLQQEINSAQFAKKVFDLWNQLEPETVKTSFMNSPKMANIESTLNKISSLGGVSCLITSSPNFFADYFYDYGFNYIFASKPFELKKGEFTPEHIIYGKDKLSLTHHLCQKLDLSFKDTVAFGDSLTDVVLFQNLDHTVSVNGDVHIKNFSKYYYNGLDLMEAFELVLNPIFPSLTLNFREK